MNLLHSATLMTWFSLSVKLLSPLILLPLILTSYSDGEVALWFLFNIITSLQLVFDMGFSQTFVRITAYATSGIPLANVKPDNTIEQHLNGRNRNSDDDMANVISSMNIVYTRLGIATLLLLGVIGSLVLIKPISEYASSSEAWYAWLSVLIVTSMSTWAGKYSAFLQGINRIAQLRFWEAITAFISIIVTAIVVFNDGSFLLLVLTSQFFLLVVIARNYLLCVKTAAYKTNISSSKIDRTVFNLVWPSAWRSGLGVFAGFGSVQATGIILAQFASASQTASYLLALRLIQTVSQYSQAPFYTKIPVLSKLNAQNNTKELLNISTKTMRISYAAFLLGFFLLTFFAEPILAYINSNVDFVSTPFWVLLGSAIFIERYGAMHIQLYSLSNKIIWHIANSITGILLITTCVILYPLIGIFAFAWGLFLSNLLFYSWYSAYHSYKEYNLNFWEFEYSVFIPPALLMAIYGLYVFTTSIN